MKKEIKTTKMKNTSNKVFSLEEAKEIWKAGQEYWKTSGESKTFEETIEPLGELLSDKKFTLEDIEQAMIEGLSIEKFWEKCVQSLSQPKSWKIELEMEFCPQALPQDRYKPELTDGKVKILRVL
jgi:hypothetical protein